MGVRMTGLTSWTRWGGREGTREGVEGGEGRRGKRSIGRGSSCGEGGRKGGREGGGMEEAHTCLHCLRNAGDGDPARLLGRQLLIDLNDGLGLVLDLSVGEGGREGGKEGRKGGEEGW
jgi:hypothetical protein